MFSFCRHDRTLSSESFFAMSRSLLWRSSLLMAEKSAERLKMGRDHLLIMLPATNLFLRVSRGCLCGCACPVQWKGIIRSL